MGGSAVGVLVGGGTVGVRVGGSTVGVLVGGSAVGVRVGGGDPNSGVQAEASISSKRVIELMPNRRQGRFMAER